MIDQLVIPDIKELIEEGNIKEVVQFLDELHPTEAAEILNNLPVEQIKTILLEFDESKRADVFCELPGSVQVELSSLFDNQDLVSIINDLSPDDQADLFKILPEETSQQVLPELDDRATIEKLVAYPEGTAGSIMTTEFVAVPSTSTAQAAIQRIRKEGATKESIYTIFLVDNQKHLVGLLSLGDIILADPEEKLSNLLESEQITSIKATASREEVVYMVKKFDLVTLPVVDENNRLVGIITHDDVIDVIEQERTEDFERFMAITGKHEDIAYLKIPVWKQFLHRVPWLVILAAVGLVSGAILQHFESALVNLVILAFYMPMLADTGGNTGSQSATVVVRALALKEIKPRHIGRVLWKELGIALMLGGVLALLAFGRVMLSSSGMALPPGMSLQNVAFAISIALGLQVVSATIIGAVLPLLAAACKLDPALIASPAITTIVDITGLFLYFSIARALLHI